MVDEEVVSQDAAASQEPATGEAEATSLEGGSISEGAPPEVNLSLRLEPGTRLRITIEALAGPQDENEQPGMMYTGGGEESSAGNIYISLPGKLQQGMQVGAPAIARRPGWLAQLFALLRGSIQAWPYSLGAVLFGLSAAVYLAVRLVGLADYPIFFFSDEAIQTNLAADLLRDNFKNQAGDFLPTYFYNVDKYSLGTTVYIHVLPYLLFGRSAVITRATSVILSLLAAICVGLALRDIFKLPYWWSGTLILSILPAWFLHSRTAFETVTMVSFYAGGLYFYLLYRYRSPRYLYAALALFALAFYSYNPGQAVVILTGLLLLLSDIGYHWQNRKTAFLGLGLLVLLALPYARFHQAHPEALQEHLVTLGSYWIQPISWQEKLAHFGREYLYGLSPGYWFIPNDRDLVRHLMKGYGHLHHLALPFALLGTGVALANIRSSAYRAVLIAFLAAPSGAALAHIAVTRALVMVIPAALLVSLGMNSLLAWLEKKRFSTALLSLALFAVLGAANVFMAWDALHNGPTWFKDYGLSGMQYGAAQLFGASRQYLEENPAAQLVVSPSWANSADVLARFFLGDPLPVRIGSIEDYMVQHLSLEDDKVFVMTPQEYEQVTTSGKFTAIRVERTLPYPDGRPGFYFVSLRYVDNVDEILAAEREARRQLREDEVVLDGQLVQVRYSMLDMGQIGDLWDGSSYSVARTFEANPFRIEMDFPTARSLSGLSMVVGDTDVRITARLFSSQDAQPVEFVAELSGSVQNPWVTFDFSEAFLAERLQLEVQDLLQGEPGHVHIWEIEFR